MSRLLYEVIMMSLHVEASSGDKTSSEEKDIILLWQHKKAKCLNLLYRKYCNLKKAPRFLRHPVHNSIYVKI